MAALTTVLWQTYGLQWKREDRGRDRKGCLAMTSIRGCRRYSSHCSKGHMQAGWGTRPHTTLHHGPFSTVRLKQETQAGGGGRDRVGEMFNIDILPPRPPGLFRCTLTTWTPATSNIAPDLRTFFRFPVSQPFPGIACPNTQCSWPKIWMFLLLLKRTLLISNSFGDVIHFIINI